MNSLKTAIFICTHGRPKDQLTLLALKKSGYTGKVYLVLDNQDNTIDEYKSLYNNLIVFDKNWYVDNCDTGSYIPNFKTILYAKNACEDIAKELGLDAFVIADDDIKSFSYRKVDGPHLKSVAVNGGMDKILDEYYRYILDNNITASSFGIPSWYLSGVNTFSSGKFKKFRCPINFVIRNTSREMKWSFDYGEDLNTAIKYNKHGSTELALPNIQIYTVPYQQGNSGMRELYDKTSNLKLVYRNIMQNPDCVSMQWYNNKIFARIYADCAYPKIISERFKNYE